MMNLFLYIIYFSACLVLYSCNKSSNTGILNLSDADEAVFNVEIPTNNYPSRLLLFEPIGGVGSMGAYKEKIYESKVLVSVQNMGREAFVIENMGDSESVGAGEIIELSKMEFKDFRLIIIPQKDKKANVTMSIKFDQNYQTKSWRLVSQWSDGP